MGNVNFLLVFPKTREGQGEVIHVNILDFYGILYWFPFVTFQIFSFFLINFWGPDLLVVSLSNRILGGLTFFFFLFTRSRLQRVEDSDVVFRRVHLSKKRT